jgi:hypothetical protein
MTSTHATERTGEQLLLTHAEALVELLEVLCACLREEQRALVLFETGALDDAAGVKPSIMALLSERWELIRDAVEALAGAGVASRRGVDAIRGVTFSTEALRAQGEDACGRIESLEETVNEMQRTNIDLTTQALMWIQGCIAEIRGEEATVGYTSGGQPLRALVPPPETR